MYLAMLFQIVTFSCPLPIAVDVYHTAFNVDRNGFELAFSQELSEELETDLPQHLGRFVTEVSQEPRCHFRFFDRNGKFVYQGIALLQFQPFQFVNSIEVNASISSDGSSIQSVAPNASRKLANILDRSPGFGYKAGCILPHVLHTIPDLQCSWHPSLPGLFYKHFCI